MNDIMKIVQALQDSNIQLKGVTKTIKNKTKEQKEGFPSMPLGPLGATTSHKIYETSSSFHVKERTTGKCNSLSPKFYFAFYVFINSQIC